MDVRAGEGRSRRWEAGVRMTTDTAQWTATDLGAMPGLGDDRPRGAAEIKKELEPGLAVVRYLYDNSRVDARWSVLQERGYTWWADGLAQRVWSEPAFDDDGIAIYRLFVESDLLRGVSVTEAASRAVDELNGLSGGSILAIDEDAATIRSVASMWVHEQSLDWIARSLSVIGATQVAMAQGQATTLVPMLGGEMALSSHPESGVRPQPDEMLGVLELVRMNGREGSLWAGDEMSLTLEQMQRVPAVLLATGDETGVTMEVPFGDATALIQLDTTWEHPDLGSGLVSRLSLPRDSAGPGWAAEQNRREIESLTRSHLIGGWVADSAFPSFRAFYPNMLARTGLAAVNVALSMIGRAHWMAAEGL